MLASPEQSHRVRPPIDAGGEEVDLLEAAHALPPPPDDTPVRARDCGSLFSATRRRRTATSDLVSSKPGVARGSTTYFPLVPRLGICCPFAGVVGRLVEAARNGSGCSGAEPYPFTLQARVHDRGTLGKAASGRVVPEFAPFTLGTITLGLRATLS